ncbi:uncharacterized protein UV8b_06401 [Ustilaginoidea virens]|uniref:Uncharacterized protein n=1 Tax=Ustilaginoidea virens TaxID=1159556 RepID=A0A8E5HV20_USTVR|nr:uncharacterized protein UV8b_06401 [Ustilaginoidea virens]QUC22160.1 hypothetical protein UV8b_06401 [Ustilaginoidea virens]
MREKLHHCHLYVGQGHVLDQVQPTSASGPTTTNHDDDDDDDDDAREKKGSPGKEKTKLARTLQPSSLTETTKDATAWNKVSRTSTHMNDEAGHKQQQQQQQQQQRPPARSNPAFHPVQITPCNKESDLDPARPSEKQNGTSGLVSQSDLAHPA